jgi:hypothetical protein
MKKFLSLLAIVALVAPFGSVALAGFDQYTGKNYTTLLAPTGIGRSMTGDTNGAIAVTKITITNLTSTGIDCAGLVGRGAIVFGVDSGGGIVTARVYTCATTNGTYGIATNDAGESVWGVTNTSAFKVIPIRPNAFSRYWRVTMTSDSNVTNGSVSAVLVTE